jgi:hypothetical protein
MSDGRRRRRAKQARRDASRRAANQRDPLGAQKRGEESSVDTTFRDVVGRALRRHPLGLLSIASVVLNVARPDLLGSPEGDADYLDRVLTGLIGTRNRETTALLALIAELLVDDPDPQRRCRREVAERGEHLPRWIGTLSRVEAYRAVRRAHVFGDVDELVIGMRLDGGHELTVAVGIDHNLSSTVVGAGVVEGPIDMALARVAETSTDTFVFEMTLNDARAWIEEALDKPRLVPKTETWPLYRPLVQWLVGRLPEGGEPRSPAWLESTEELCDTFFAGEAAAPFMDSGHREMLLQLLESGTGDPLRWSGNPRRTHNRQHALPRGQYSVGSCAGRSRSAPRIRPLRARAERDTGRTHVANTGCDRRSADELQAEGVEGNRLLVARRRQLSTAKCQTPLQ